MTTLERQRVTLPAAAPVGHPPSPVYDTRAETGDNEPGIGEVLSRLHQMMRGRYILCSILSLLCAAGFGYAGFKAGARTYRSSGLIRVVPTLPRIMYETEDKGVMPMFDSFVQTQVSLIKTQRVLENALDDRSWPTPPPRDSAAIADFGKRLVVMRDNELIAIAFDDPDPVFAQNAVKCVITAYRELFVANDVGENSKALDQLLPKLSALNRDLAANQSRIRAIAERYGTDKIDDFFSNQLKDVQQLESTLAGLRLQQSMVAAQTRLPGGPTPEMLAAEDSELASLLTQRHEAATTLRELTAAGLGDRNSKVIAAQKQLAAIEELINERVDATQRAAGTAAGALKLNEEINTVTESLKAARDKLKAIGLEQFQLADLRTEAEHINELLTQTKSRIEQLNTEAPMATGRITIVSPGDRPLVAARDTRQTFAGAAAATGLVLPFGAALLLASTNRRYGAPVETRMSSITRDLVLGALPSVDEHVFDAEGSQLAAHCLHQVRTMLQIRCNGHAKAIAVTSSTAGSGKTSVVLGLGVSYAMAGSRTLLIDLDLVGGGLTRRAEVNARARLGQLLLTQGLVTADQLEEALATAKAKGLKVGEAFVELGFLQPDQLAAILEEQKRSHVGLMDALNGATVKDCVTNAGTEGLDILPLGSANAHDAATLSPSEIKSVIDEAKTMYDTILIDTGPVPGSLEASMVTSLADGVLLIVARGEHRASAERSIEHIRRIGGRVAGLVFNRAKASDAGLIGGSMYHVSTSSPSEPIRPAPSASRHASFARFGPVGQAVLDLAPGAMN